MAAPDQHKIGSGFGARSTAAEVIDGIDLTGKLAIAYGQSKTANALFAV
jgi:hypothetical protein